MGVLVESVDKDDGVWAVYIFIAGFFMTVGVLLVSRTILMQYRVAQKEAEIFIRGVERNMDIVTTIPPGLCKLCFKAFNNNNTIIVCSCCKDDPFHAKCYNDYQIENRGTVSWKNRNRDSERDLDSSMTVEKCPSCRGLITGVQMYKVELPRELSDRAQIIKEGFVEVELAAV